MKKLVSVLLCVVMLCTLTAPALADELRCDPPLPPPSEPPVEPTPPEWIKAEDYVVFPGDEVYQPENWAKIEALRQEARSGKMYDGSNPIPPKDEDLSPGTLFEYSLVGLRIAQNGTPGDVSACNVGADAYYGFQRVISAAKDLSEDALNRVRLLGQRAYAIYGPGLFFRSWGKTLYPVLAALDLTLNDFFDAPYTSAVSDSARRHLYEDMNLFLDENGYSVRKYTSNEVQLFLDEQYLLPGVVPQSRNGCTMVSILHIAEALGADADWNSGKNQLTLARAGQTVVLTAGSASATLNGKPVSLDAAPYLSDGYLLAPASCLSTLFQQKLEWNEKNGWLLISEDKSVAGNSNVEDWATSMGAMRPWMDGIRYSPRLFGEVPRTAQGRDAYRESLFTAWGIYSREGLIQTIQRMTYFGHNISFQQSAASLNALSDAQYQKLLADCSAHEQYLLEQTKRLSAQWGDTGILAWDLSRMSNLCQWGYAAGYLTYEEALTLAQPVAQLARAHFSSWEEFFENYLGGFMWWDRQSVSAGRTPKYDVWACSRGGTCRSMLSRSTFDDTLFDTGVIPLPAG